MRSGHPAARGCQVLFALAVAMLASGCTVLSVVDTAASVTVHAVGAAADMAIDAASVAGKAASSAASAAIDAVKPAPKDAAEAAAKAGAEK